MTNTIYQNGKRNCFLIALFFAMGSAPLVAQTSSGSVTRHAASHAPATEDTKEIALAPAAKGTYQILAKDAQSHEIFPIDILLEIEKNRSEKDVVFMKAGQSSVIRILPYKTIRSRNFEPLPETGVQQ